MLLPRSRPQFPPPSVMAMGGRLGKGCMRCHPICPRKAKTPVRAGFVSIQDWDIVLYVYVLVLLLNTYLKLDVYDSVYILNPYIVMDI